MSRIEREKHIIEVMVEIYCKKKHKSKDGLCSECRELLDYSRQRLDKCKFGEQKSYCQKCPIHCYKKDMKEKSLIFHSFDHGQRENKQLINKRKKPIIRV